MKISFNSWLYGSAFGWLPSRSLEDTVDTLAEIGYDGIEIGAAAPHGFPAHTSTARRKEILKHVKSRGMEVSALCPALGGGPGYNPASPEKEERDANFQYISECLQLAHDLECENVIWLPGWKRYKQPRQEAWDYAVEALHKCAEVARPLGVKLAVEPTSEVSDVIEHAGDSLKLMKDAGVGSDVAGVMLDTIHVFYRGDDVREQFNEAGENLIYVHISDINRDAPGVHTDFRPAIDELALIGYDGWLSMEIGFPRRDRNPDGITRQAIEYLRPIVEGTQGRLASWRNVSVK
ncbi:sugar phosphate isomerase/epimerase family protein [Paenibacillus abyssi]|uniref:Sugar phosphate isomerase n=1 Tax=Paenibacillus abyssi TaxID=1340531 RepID=A0A917FRH7_9BACL|nr:sugar phosphate isomerase/epimerase family protein [Paenibacillus abyssi]GGG01572.1 sugar phosphate isomerase [Paenibacillus abyssi]